MIADHVQSKIAGIFVSRKEILWLHWHDFYFVSKQFTNVSWNKVWNENNKQDLIVECWSSDDGRSNFSLTAMIPSPKMKAKIIPLSLAISNWWENNSATNFLWKKNCPTNKVCQKVGQMLLCDNGIAVKKEVASSTYPRRSLERKRCWFLS